MAGFERRRVALVSVNRSDNPPTTTHHPPVRHTGTQNESDDNLVKPISDKVEKFLKDGIEPEQLFEKDTKVSWETIMAIRAQQVQRSVRQSSQNHNARLHLYLEQYNKGVKLVDIARNNDRFPPFLLAKYMAPLILRTNKEIKSKTLLQEAERAGNIRFRNEIFECQEVDLDYTPAADRIRAACGFEYEYKLQRELKALGIIFKHENDLRTDGYHKTPDILLHVPIAINLTKLNDPWSKRTMKSQTANEGEGSYRVIRWIDSKAMFGDFLAHVRDNKAQIQSYINRFGPGLVIYWFGFDPLISSAQPEVSVLSTFPADAIIMI